MSTASRVPETWRLSGDDAARTLADTGRWRLVHDGFLRLRLSDGFSHARSMAYAGSLVFIQAVIAVVGFAGMISAGGVSDVITGTLRAIVPGQAGTILTEAIRQAHRASASNRSLALALGTIGALITGVTLLGQVERALNRLYGIEQDRPTLEKYGRALVLTLTAGVLAAVGFTALGLGHGITSAITSGSSRTVWTIVRWPLAIVMLTASTVLIMRWSPRRRQPGWSWLAFGAGVAVLLQTAATMLLDLGFRLSSTFGQTYGPLAGFIALLLWAFLVSIALLLGAALAAQLEAVRAGAPGPQSLVKVDGSDAEPEADAPISPEPVVQGR